MNVPKIISRARFKSGISNANTLTYGELSAICYEGNILLEREISKLNQDVMEEQRSIADLVALSSLYSWPNDALAIKQVRLAYTTPTGDGDYKIAMVYDPVMVKDVQTQEENISSATPIVDLTGRYLRIKPTPTAASTGGLMLYYIPTTVLSGSATPNFPSEYHELISTYAAKEACGRFEKWDKYKMLDKEWAEGVAKMRDDLSVLYTNDVGRVRNAIEDGAYKSNTELF